MMQTAPRGLGLRNKMYDKNLKIFVLKGDFGLDDCRDVTAHELQAWQYLINNLPDSADIS